MQDEKYFLFFFLNSSLYSPSCLNILVHSVPSSWTAWVLCVHSVTSYPCLFPLGSYSTISSELFFHITTQKCCCYFPWQPTSVLYTHHTYWWSGLSTSCCCWVVSDSCDPMDCNPLGSSLMGFSRQEYWSGLPFPSPGDLPNPGIEPASQADSWVSETSGKQIMAKSSKQNWHSFESLARFRVPFSATFPNDDKGLLGIPNNRCCHGYSRGFCHANRRWHTALHIPGNKELC